MKKKTKIFAGLAAVCLIILSIFVGTAIAKNEPVMNQFVKYLEENGYSCSEDVCSMQSKIEEGSIEETYTETYNFNDNTFAVKFVHDDRSKEIITEMEYVYNYKDDTITVNQYDTEDAITERKPDAVYSLNREEMVECIYGNGSADEIVLHDNMLRFKQVFVKHLEESGAALQDIIR